MQKYYRAIALIRKPAGHRTAWLARWDPRAKCYTLIAAEPLEQESFREAIDREVGWVLGLRRDRDYLVSNMARLNLEFQAPLPGDPHDTHVAVAFYLVDMYRQTAWHQLDGDPENRWLTADEICAGRTREGQPVDAKLSFLIRRSEVIQPWQ